MDLSGSIHQEGLREIFQAILNEKRSGTLELRHDQHRHWLFFREGLVCSGRSASINLVQFVQSHRELNPNSSIRQVLDYAEAHLINFLVDTLQWARLSYTLTEDSPRKVESVLRVPREGTFLFDRARELLDTWEKVRTILPQPYMFLHVRAGPALLKSMTPEEQLLLSSIHAGIPVRDLTKNFPRGRYYFQVLLAQLLKNGVIRPVDPSSYDLGGAHPSGHDSSRNSPHAPVAHEHDPVPASRAASKPPDTSGKASTFAPKEEEIELGLSFIDDLLGGDVGEVTPKTTEEKKPKKKAKSVAKAPEPPPPPAGDDDDDINFDALFTRDGAAMLHAAASAEFAPGTGPEDDVSTYFIHDMEESHIINLAGAPLVEDDGPDSIYFIPPKMEREESQHGLVPYSGISHPLRLTKSFQLMNSEEQRATIQRFLDYLGKVAVPLELIHPDISPHLEVYVRACIDDKKDFSLMAMVQKYFTALIQAPPFLQEEVLASLDKIVKGIVRAKKLEHLNYSVQYLAEVFRLRTSTRVFERVCQYCVVVSRALQDSGRVNQANEISGWFVEEFEKNPSKEFVRQRLALRVLGELGTVPANDAIRKAIENYEWRELALDALKRAGAVGVQCMLAVLAKADKEDLRESVIQILSSVGRPGALQLVKAMEAEDFQIRVAAVEALAQLRHPETYPAIQRAIKDQAPQVRVAALKVLPQIGIPSLEPFLIRMMEDPDERVRMEVLQLANQSPSVKIMQALRLNIVTKLFANGDGDDPLLIEACRVLGAYQNPQTIPDFIRLLRNRDLQVSTRDGLVMWEICRQLVDMKATQALPYLDEVAEKNLPVIQPMIQQAITAIRNGAKSDFFKTPPKPKRPPKGKVASQTSGAAPWDELTVDL